MFRYLLFYLVVSKVVSSTYLLNQNCSTRVTKVDDQNETLQAVDCYISNQSCNKTSNNYLSAPHVEVKYLNRTSSAIKLNIIPELDTFFLNTNGYTVSITKFNIEKKVLLRLKKYVCLKNSLEDYGRMVIPMYLFDEIGHNDFLLVKVSPLTALNGVLTVTTTVSCPPVESSYDSYAFEIISEDLPYVKVLSNTSLCFNGSVSLGVYLPKISNIIDGDNKVVLTTTQNKIVKIYYRSPCRNIYMRDTILFDPKQSSMELTVRFGKKALRDKIFIDECSSSFSLRNIAIVIVVTIFVFVVLCIAFYFILKNVKKKKFKKLFLNQSEICLPEEDKFIDKKTRVYVCFFDTDNSVEILAQKLSRFLVSVGVEVVYDNWNQSLILNSVHQYIHDTVMSCDKFVIVWSQGAVDLFNSPKQNQSSVSSSSCFFPVVSLLKSELINATKTSSEVLSVCFDSCALEMIPDSFKRLSDLTFLLTEQLMEFYMRLVERKSYAPGQEITLNISDSIDEKFKEFIENYRNGEVVEKSSNFNTKIYVEPPLEEGTDLIRLDVISPMDME